MVLKNKNEILNLVRNIIEFIGLKDLEIELKFGSEFYSHHSSMMIELCKNSYIKKRHLNISKEDYKTFEYFNNLGISEQFYFNGWYIFSTLHEIGHLELFKRYNGYINMDQLYTIHCTSKHILDSINKKTFNINQKYNLTYQEVYADQFAYKWFPIIWDKFNVEILKIIQGE